MELIHQVPDMLNSGLQYIIPMMADIYIAVLPFAYIVLKAFLILDIAITCFKKWVVGENVNVAQQYRDDWYWD